MKRIKGRITHWNRRKAYGFITPETESKEVFVHISEFRDRRNMPSLEDEVEYILSTDKQGRPCATDVSRAPAAEEADSEDGGSLMVWMAVAAVVIVAGVLYFVLG